MRFAAPSHIPRRLVALRRQACTEDTYPARPYIFLCPFLESSQRTIKDVIAGFIAFIKRFYIEARYIAPETYDEGGSEAAGFRCRTILGKVMYSAAGLRSYVWR